MRIPKTFHELPAEELQSNLIQLAYHGGGRFVALWWEPARGELVWADDTGRAPVGLGASRPWRDAIAIAFPAYDFGSSDGPGLHVLLWDRVQRRAWAGLREEVLAFVCRRWLEAGTGQHGE